MRWLIPAKTFFLGEYIAISGGPAIILTTTPCFEVCLNNLAESSDSFHPDSPAGQFWGKNKLQHLLGWHDPYQGLGGLGASSAQFLGAYWADCYLHGKSPSKQDIINQYRQVAWSGEGKRPSGYDVLAQASQGCALIDDEHGIYESHDWPFHDVAFILVHTGQKLATHEHLKRVVFNETKQSVLYDIARSACQEFRNGHAKPLIDAVNHYYAALLSMNLVAAHTVEQIEHFSSHIKPLAIKGCGALGADVILMLVSSERLLTVTEQISQAGYYVISTSKEIYRESDVIFLTKCGKNS